MSLYYYILISTFSIFMGFQPILPMSLTCQTGEFARHNAFDVVFKSFPDRYDDNVVRYIALVDCNTIGDDVFVIVDNEVYQFRVADCLNRSEVPRPGYLGDIDAWFWQGHRFPNAPVTLTVCDRDPFEYYDEVFREVSFGFDFANIAGNFIR